MTQANVWVAFPSADVKRASKTRDKWQAQGYKVCLFFNMGVEPACADYVFQIHEYKGYWWACNQMAKVLVKSRSADVICFAADDIDPDPNHTAQEIGAEYLEKYPDGFGVMQPCGDPQGELIDGKHNAARICGSPWMGRGWIERAYEGKGPFPEQYFHFFGDEHVYNVAGRLGVLWMRPDLTQDHRHWAFGRQPKTTYQERNGRGWQKDKTLFEKEKAQGFPGSQPKAKAQA